MSHLSVSSRELGNALWLRIYISVLSVISCSTELLRLITRRAIHQHLEAARNYLRSRLLSARSFFGRGFEFGAGEVDLVRLRIQRHRLRPRFGLQSLRHRQLVR